MASTGVATAALAGSADESRFVALINASRSAAGLGPLTVEADLVAYARRHTAAMIAEGDIFHSSQGELGAATSGWTLLGENVGMGPNPDILHQAFMASPSHRANILGTFNYVGVGTDLAEDGTMYVTVVFAQKPVPASAPPPSTTVPPTTTTTVVATTTTVVAPPPPRRPVPEMTAVEAIARRAFLEGTLCVDLAPFGRVCVE